MSVIYDLTRPPRTYLMIRRELAAARARAMLAEDDLFPDGSVAFTSEEVREGALRRAAQLTAELLAYERTWADDCPIYRETRRQRLERMANEVRADGGASRRRWLARVLPRSAGRLAFTRRFMADTPQPLTHE